MSQTRSRQEITRLPRGQPDHPLRRSLQANEHGLGIPCLDGYGNATNKDAVINYHRVVTASRSHVQMRVADSLREPHGILPPRTKDVEIEHHERGPTLSSHLLLRTVLERRLRGHRLLAEVRVAG